MKLTKNLILTTKKEEELACLLSIDINKIGIVKGNCLEFTNCFEIPVKNLIKLKVRVDCLGFLEIFSEAEIFRM